MDGETGLGGRQQLQRHVELWRAEVSQMLGSTHFSNLGGEKKKKKGESAQPLQQFYFFNNACYSYVL